MNDLDEKECEERGRRIGMVKIDEVMTSGKAGGLKM